MHLNGNIEEYEQNSALVRVKENESARKTFESPVQETSFCLDASVPDPEVCILDLINELDGRIRDKIKDYMVSYFSPKLKCYVYVGVADTGLKSNATTGETVERVQQVISGKKDTKMQKAQEQVDDPINEDASDRPRSVANAREKLSDLVQPDTQEIILKFR